MANTFQNANQDAAALAGLINNASGNVQTRTGGSKPVYSQVISDIRQESQERINELARNFNLTSSGFDFATGGTVNFPNELIEDSTGQYWQWQGTYPHTVTPGTTPSSPDYEIRVFSDHSVLSNRNATNAHDGIYSRNFASVAQMRAQTSSDGTVVNMFQMSGARVFWRGYNSESDGGSNWGIVKTGDSSSLTDDGGSIFVIVNSAVNGVWVEANLGKKINIAKFGATGSSDVTPFLNRVQDYLIANESSGAINLRTNYTMNSQFILDSRISLIAPTPANVLLTADFSAWTQADNHSIPDNTAIVVKGRDSLSDEGVGFSQVITGFTVMGSNNAALISTAFYYGMLDRRTLTVSSTINVAVRALSANNVNVTRFDTAHHLGEVWQSDFEKMDVRFCRRGFVLTGQVVNTTFRGKGVIACRLDYTSSTDNREAMRCDGATNYGPSENVVLRPEGVSCSQLNIIGADIGFISPNSLSVTLDQCIIDLHADTALSLGTSANFKASKCYISSAGTNQVILMSNTPVSTDLSESIVDCDIVRIAQEGNTGLLAIRATDRKGVRYNGNNHTGFVGGIVCRFDQCDDYEIKGNIFKLGSDGWTSQRCIDITAGNGGFIDKNISYNTNKILQLSPVIPSLNLRIGDNYSQAQKTSELGSVTIPAGQTSVTQDFTFNQTNLGAGSDTGITSIVNANINQSVAGFRVQPNGVNSNRCTFSIDTAIGSDSVIQYNLNCIGAA